MSRRAYRWTDEEIKMAKEFLSKEKSLISAAKKLSWRLRRKVSPTALRAAFLRRGLYASDFTGDDTRKGHRKKMHWIDKLKRR